MPSNIFANTGTNVSVIFIDKTNTEGNVILLDASKLGTKVKVGKNQKTVLSSDELSLIVNTFINQEAKDDFSVVISFEDVSMKNYSFSAGQYFEVKIDHIDITKEEFEEKMECFQDKLDSLFSESKELEQQIKSNLKVVKYE